MMGDGGRSYTNPFEVQTQRPSVLFMNSRFFFAQCANCPCFGTIVIFMGSAGCFSGSVNINLSGLTKARMDMEIGLSLAQFDGRLLSAGSVTAPSWFIQDTSV